MKQCLFLTKVNKTMVVDFWAWRDHPLDQVGPILTSRLNEFRAEVVYCQWQYIQLQILTMTQPRGSHYPLYGSHLNANKVTLARSCVGIGLSQRECSPLYRGEGFCSTSLFLDFSWKVGPNPCGSDHFPIILENDGPS